MADVGNCESSPNGPLFKTSFRGSWKAFSFGKDGENLIKKNSSTSLMVIAVIGLAAFAGISAWQFYLFAIFKAADGTFDVQGGAVHLWLSIGSAIMGCLVGFFVFSRLFRYDKQDELHITSPGHPLGVGRTRKDS